MKWRFFVLFHLLAVLICCNQDENPDYICSEWDNVCENDTIILDPTKLWRKVLIIGIDGFRADAMKQNITPFLWSLSQDSSVYFTDKNLVEELTYSGPNWSSLCTGVNFCKHRVFTNGFENNQLTEFPHFFKYIESSPWTKNTASVVNWTPINEHLAGSFADFAPIFELSDSLVFVSARDLLRHGFPMDPSVLFLQFDELDAAGHDYGFHPTVPEYATTLTRLDSYIDTLFSIVNESRASGDDWLVCVVSDHGGEGTEHSGLYDDEDVRHTIMFMESPDVNFKHWYTSSQTDLAPTVLDYLGIESAEFNCKTDGFSVISN